MGDLPLHPVLAYALQGLHSHEPPLSLMTPTSSLLLETELQRSVLWVELCPHKTHVKVLTPARVEFGNRSLKRD